MRSSLFKSKPRSLVSRARLVALAAALPLASLAWGATPAMAVMQIISFGPMVMDTNRLHHLEGTTALPPPAVGTDFPVGSFTDSSCVAPCDPATYIITVFWGDNTTGTGTATLVNGTNGTFNVVATHAFTDEFFTPPPGTPTGFQDRIHVTPPSQPNSVYISLAGLFAVRDATLSPTGSTYVITPSPIASKPFSGQIAQFLDANLLAAATDMGGAVAEYGLSIDWGDGNSSDTTHGSVVVESPCSTTCTIDVFGTHTYNYGGQYNVTVTVNDGSNIQKLPASATATVQQFVTGTVNSDSTGTDNPEGLGNQAIDIGSFTDSDACPSSCQPVTDYVVALDWGDGTQSPATSVSFRNAAGTTGTYDVEGAHTYAVAGSYFIAMTVTDNGDNLSNVSFGSITVGEEPLDQFAGGFTFSGPEAKVAFNTRIGTFHDDNQLLVANDGASPEYTISIDWGDGTALDTTSGTFAIGPCGASEGPAAGQGCAVTISGGHTFAAAGSFAATITVNDGGTLNLIHFTAHVAAASAAVHQSGAGTPGGRGANQSGAAGPGPRLAAVGIKAAAGRISLAPASATATTHSAAVTIPKLMDAKLWLFGA